MIKLNTRHQPLTISYPAPEEFESARRLIVPIPGPDVDITTVVHRVWELANATGARIKFIGLCNDTEQEPGVRRALVTLSAMVNCGSLSADTEIIFGRNWVDNLKSRLQPGDMVVYWNEPYTGLLRKPFSQLLQTRLDVPVYFLPALSAEKDPQVNRLSLTFAWIGFATIIIGFLFLQIKIYQLAENWAMTLEILSTIGEFWLIWVWNNLFK